MNVAVVVPTAMADPDAAPRRAAWEWLRERYERVHPDWQLVEAPDPEEGRFLWSKGRAINSAVETIARDYVNAEVLVIADADVVAHTAALAECTRAVTLDTEPDWAVPFGRVYRLGRKATEAWLDHAIPDEAEPTAISWDEGLGRPVYRGVPGGGVVVLTRQAFDEVGGLDERFTGWGGEDRALACALRALVGEYHRTDHPLLHLWHPPAHGPDARMPTANQSLLHRYRHVARDAPKMRRLLNDREEWRASWDADATRHPERSDVPPTSA